MGTNSRNRLNLSDIPPDLKLRLRLAAHAAGVSMNRYVFDVLDAHLPPLPRQEN